MTSNIDPRKSSLNIFASGNMIWKPPEAITQITKAIVVKIICSVLVTLLIYFKYKGVNIRRQIKAIKINSC